MKPAAGERLTVYYRVFPRIRAGASLKHNAWSTGPWPWPVFPRIRAGASLKLSPNRGVLPVPTSFSPAFVRGPH